MAGLTEVLCFILLVIALGACLVRAIWEFEAARERRVEQKRLIGEAMRSVLRMRERRE